MNMQAFSFNRDASYQAGAVYPAQVKTGQLIQPSIQVVLDNGTAVSEGAFEAKYPDVFQKYRLPYVESDKLVQAWNSNPMQFWQNQLNFAVWCAMSGTGVSAEDHLAVGTMLDPLMRAIYSFHVYYQVRRVLAELQTPLPQDQAWSAFDNPYDRRAYERICSEFGVSPHTAWQVKGLNSGLGRVYNYWTNNGYHPIGTGEYDSRRMSFTKKTTNEILHVDFIKQDDPQVANAWATFILDKSKGFTHAGVERLNDSIRTYVWAILGAQAQTRTRILGTGTAFDAQKQFLANVEDAISSPVDLPSAINRYQDVLQYAGSKLNFVFGIGLYMAPGDMLLRIGQVAGYNNEIFVATQKQKLGVNAGINVTAPPPNAAGYTGEKGIVEPLIHHVFHSPQTIGRATAAHALETVSGRTHDEEKTALVVGGVAVGLLVLALRH
jgi:hypothetical protein